jgi:hypothetical protein
MEPVSVQLLKYAHFLRQPKAEYRTHKLPPLVSFLNQMSQLSQLCLCLLSGLCPSDARINNLYKLHISLLQPTFIMQFTFTSWNADSLWRT